MPDAWRVLQTFRAKYPDDAKHVALDHVMTAANGPNIGESLHLR